VDKSYEVLVAGEADCKSRVSITYVDPESGNQVICQSDEFLLYIADGEDSGIVYTSGLTEEGLMKAIILIMKNVYAVGLELGCEALTKMVEELYDVIESGVEGDEH